MPEHRGIKPPGRLELPPLIASVSTSDSMTCQVRGRRNSSIAGFSGAESLAERPILQEQGRNVELPDVEAVKLAAKG